MMRSLYTAVTGMKANQAYVDNISNNLANLSTTGFKKSKIEFEDLIYQTLREAGTESAEGQTSPVGIQIGLGTRMVATQKIFLQGNLEQTGNSKDVAIEGEGFFQIRQTNGEIAYSRNGAFKISGDGYLTNSDGMLLEPPIVVPADTRDIAIDASGVVTAQIGSSETYEEIGQIELANFINPAGLMAKGGGLYYATDASGLPVVGQPNEDGFGQLRNQYLENSNVQMVEEMVNMIMAQRAYEVSSKAISTSDEMLQTASGLKR